MRIRNFFIFSFKFLNFVFLFLLHRKLKKGFENLSEKNFTNKKQEKTFSILFVITIILLLIFKFGYYEKDYKIDVPDDFFVTNLENEEIDSKENLYFELKKFKELKIDEEFRFFKQNIFACLYKDKCYFEKQEYKDGIEAFKNIEKLELEKDDLIKIGEELERDLEKIQNEINNKNDNLEFLKQERQIVEDYRENNKKIKGFKKKIYDLRKSKIIKERINYYFDKGDKYKNLEGKDRVDVKRLLRKNLEKIFLNPKNDENLEKFLSLSEAKYFKENNLFLERILSYSFLQSSARELLYKIAYLLEKGEEEKAVDILKKQLDISLKILNGDSSLIPIIVSNYALILSFDGLEGFLNKFDLSEKSKKELLDIIEKYKFSTEKIFENIVKMEYKYRDSSIDYIWENDFKDIFLDFNFDKKFISFLWDIELVKKIDKKYYYDLIKNNFEYEIFKIKFFSKNILGQYMARSNLYIFTNSHIHKLKKLEELQNNLIEKLKK